MSDVVRKYQLQADLIYDISDFYKGCNIKFYSYDLRGRTLCGYIQSGVLHIKEGFTWDGCTPKFRIFGIIFGVPDFNETYRASAIHDFLINHEDEHSMSRYEMDMIFDKLLQEDNFKYRCLYTTGVNLYRISLNK